MAGFSRKIPRAGGGVGAAIVGGVEAAEPPPDLERAGEGLLHRHLLVEDEPDEQGQRLLGEEAIGLVVAREVEVRGAGGRHAPILVMELSSFPRDDLGTSAAQVARSALGSKAGGGPGCPGG